MKKNILLISITAIGMFSANFVNAQCNTSMAGTFIESDSCTGWKQFQSSTVSIVSNTGTDITIQKFAEIIPYFNANVTLDCSNHTASMPTQYPGQISIWGNGTFSSNYNTMTLNFSMDFNTYTLTCVGKFTRQGTNGITDETAEQNKVSVFPNPSNGKFTITMEEVSGKMGDVKFAVYNVLGERVYSSIINNQSTIINLSALPAGIYFLQVNTGEEIVNRKVVLQK